MQNFAIVMISAAYAWMMFLLCMLAPPLHLPAWLRPPTRQRQRRTSTWAQVWASAPAAGASR